MKPCPCPKTLGPCSRLARLPILTPQVEIVGILNVDLCPFCLARNGGLNDLLDSAS